MISRLNATRAAAALLVLAALRASAVEDLGPKDARPLVAQHDWTKVRRPYMRRWLTPETFDRIGGLLLEHTRKTLMIE